MARANSQIAREVRRMVGCTVSSFNQLTVPGAAIRLISRSLNPATPRAMKKITRAMPNPGIAPTMLCRM
ncbi:hypothetical protein D9M71_630260 [compost metagenome]